MASSWGAGKNSMLYVGFIRPLFLKSVMLGFFRFLFLRQKNAIYTWIICRFDIFLTNTMFFLTIKLIAPQ